MPTYKFNGQVGYYGYSGTQYVTKRLKYQPYAQAGIYIHENGDTDLYSYDSLIMRLDTTGILTVYPEFNYSATTAKHVGSFLKEYNLPITYHTIKSHLKDFKNGELKLNSANGNLVGE